MGRRGLRVAASSLALVTLMGAAYWAGLQAIVPPSLGESPPAPQTYAVAEGTVEDEVKLAVQASWPSGQEIATLADGVVTTIPYSGGLASTGDVVVTVGLAPVVVADGHVPMFRDLELGSRGPDVEQLQSLLRELGHLATDAQTGEFDGATEEATRQWQRELGVEITGQVSRNGLVFVPVLPARLEILVEVGDLVSQGTPLLAVVAAQPAFVAVSTLSQALELETGMEILLHSPTTTVWTGTLGTFSEQGDGRVSIAIANVDCGACDSVAIAGDTTMSGTVVLVPSTTGPIVPVAALVQLPSGGLAVQLPTGTNQPVEVVAEANGFAVVDGIAAGTEILLSAGVGQ